MQGLGYKEILDYLDGGCTLEEAVYILKRDTRHFAKRQLTWFRREKDVRWLDLDQYQGNTDLILADILKGLRTGRNRAKIANRKKSNLIKIGVITQWNRMF